MTETTERHVVLVLPRWQERARGISVWQCEHSQSPTHTGHLAVPLPPDTASPHAKTDPNGHNLEPANTETALPAAGERYTFTAVIAADDCLQLTLDTSGVQSRHLERAVPFLVEEYLADDLDAMHIAHGDVQDDRVTVIAVARTVMDGWLSILKDMSLQPDAMCAGTQLIGSRSGQAQLIMTPDQWGFDLPGYAAAVLDPVQAETVLPRLAKEHAFKTFQVIHEHDAVMPNWLAVLLAERNIALESNSLPESFTQTLVERTHTAPGIPLLQGRYRTAGRRGAWQQWLRLARLAALLLIGLSLTNLVLGVREERQANRAQVAAERLYKELFPDESGHGLLRRRLEVHLADMQGVPRAGFADRFHAAMAPLQSEPPEVDRGIQSLTYNAGKDQLTLQIRFADAEAAERYRAALPDPTWPAQLEGLEQDKDGGVIARLKLGVGAK